MNFSILKKYFPRKFLNFLANFRANVYAFLDEHQPYLNYIKYCGFNLYYLRGTGLVQRIRFLNPDRIYERELSEHIVAELLRHSEPLFLDIGSNIGLISLYVASKVPKAKVYAFEPGPSQAKLFGITILANQLENRIKLLPQAVGKENGRTKFFISQNYMHSGSDGIIDTKRAKSTRAIEVPQVTLDDWWQNSGQPKVNVVKMDIEGAELWALQGAKDFLQRCRPVVFLEISVLNLAAYPYKARDIFDFFKNLNYQLTSLSGQILTVDNLPKMTEETDSFVARLL